MIKKLALSAVVLASSLFATGEVNVYSHRHYDSDKILFKKFEDKTGIKVNVVTAKAEELVSKLAIEGENTPADLLITSDIGNLYEAKSRSLLQATNSKILTENIEISENYKVKFIFSDGSIVEYDKNSKLGDVDDKI